MGRSCLPSQALSSSERPGHEACQSYETLVRNTQQGTDGDGATWHRDRRGKNLAKMITR